MKQRDCALRSRDSGGVLHSGKRRGLEARRGRRLGAHRRRGPALSLGVDCAGLCDLGRHPPAERLGIRKDTRASRLAREDVEGGVDEGRVRGGQVGRARELESDSSLLVSLLRLSVLLVSVLLVSVLDSETSDSSPSSSASSRAPVRVLLRWPTAGELDVDLPPRDM